jgi:hypothetical protein
MEIKNYVNYGILIKVIIFDKIDMERGTPMTFLDRLYILFISRKTLEEKD